MRRIQLKHFSPASCWSECLCLAVAVGRARCHTSLDRSCCVWDAVPALPAATSPLCRGTLLLLRPPARLCAQAELASWAGCLCFGRGGVSQARDTQDPSDRAMEGRAPNWEDSKLRIKRCLLCLSPGKKELCVNSQTEMQPHGSGSLEVPGAAEAALTNLWQVLCREGGCHSCWVDPGAPVAAMQSSAVPLMLGTLDLPFSMAWSCSAGSQQPLLSGTPFCRSRFHEENARHMFNLPLSPLTPIQ